MPNANNNASPMPNGNSNKDRYEELGTIDAGECEVWNDLPAKHTGYIYCHSCDAFAFKENFVVEEHPHHVIEIVPPNDRPTMERSGKIYACYNVYDPDQTFAFSIQSVDPHVDAYIIVEGPYRYFPSDEDLSKRADVSDYDPDVPRDAADQRCRDIVASNTDKPVFYISTPDTWQSEMQKRTQYMNRDFLRLGDWLLVIDDDELLVCQGPDSLRENIQFSTCNVLSLGHKMIDVEYKRVRSGLAMNIISSQHHGVEDYASMTRLFRWRPGIHYKDNHYTVAVPVRTHNNKTIRMLVVPEARIWSAYIAHIKHTSSQKNKRQKRYNYAFRNATGLEKKRPEDFTNEM